MVSRTYGPIVDALIDAIAAAKRAEEHCHTTPDALADAIDKLTEVLIQDMLAELEQRAATPQAA